MGSVVSRLVSCFTFCSSSLVTWWATVFSIYLEDFAINNGNLIASSGSVLTPWKSSVANKMQSESLAALTPALFCGGHIVLFDVSCYDRSHGERTWSPSPTIASIDIIQSGSNDLDTVHAATLIALTLSNTRFFFSMLLVPEHKAMHRYPSYVLSLDKVMGCITHITTSLHWA